MSTSLPVRVATGESEFTSKFSVRRLNFALECQCWYLYTNATDHYELKTILTEQATKRLVK